MNSLDAITSGFSFDCWLDETWIHYTPKTKVYFKRVDCKRDSKQRNTFIFGLKSDDCFWDSHGVILIDYIQTGKSITGAYYALYWTSRWLIIMWKNILFPQDSASTQNSRDTITKIHELWFELLGHAPCSPYLAPSIFFLFLHLLCVEDCDRVHLYWRENFRVLFERVK